jgi:molecular chaperone GrpE
MSTNETKEPEYMSEQHEDSLGEKENLASENDTSPSDAENNVEAGSEENDRISELQRQAEENHSRFLRAQADFDNFRRRTLKEKEELAQYASLKLVGQLLPVLDNFQRALQTGEGADSASFTKGIEMIYRQLSQVLEEEGLKPMEPVGQPFDPELHQAIMQVESDEYEEGVVVEVVQPGYRLKDKVIRPAMVKVSG